MRPNAVGKIQREGIGLLGLAAISPDDEVAAKWICTNEHQGDQGLPGHEVVKHAVGEWVKGLAHANGVDGRSRVA